ncbi:MAG TPA: hypothetical protein VHE54_16990 [Puia sp.]|nr:hypothetical protein [Puia sp.]
MLFGRTPGDFHDHAAGHHFSTLNAWIIAQGLASICNLIAPIVVWRTMRVIRRNFKLEMLETFG